MSTLRATNIKNPDSSSNNIVLDGNGGVVISGVTTSSSFVGNVTGNATGLSGTPNLNVGVVTASSFVGNVTGNATGLSGTPNIVLGIATVSAGSTSAPSITPSGDPNTGIFFPSADTIAFAEGGTEVARFDSSGRFGLGTINPQYSLDVLGDINFTGTFRQNGSAFVASRWTAGTGDDIYRLNGDVGIGTTNPTSKLQVVGDATISGIVTATTLSKTTLSDYADKINALGNTGTAATINLANGNFVTATLTGNCQFTFTTGIGTGAQSFTLFLTNDATPSRTITWPLSVKWPGGSVPVRTETANKTDVYSFFTFDNGTNWYGTLSIYNYS